MHLIILSLNASYDSMCFLFFSSKNILSRIRLKSLLAFQHLEMQTQEQKIFFTYSISIRLNILTALPAVHAAVLSIDLIQIDNYANLVSLRHHGDSIRRNIIIPLDIKYSDTLDKIDARKSVFVFKSRKYVHELRFGSQMP